MRSKVWAGGREGIGRQQRITSDMHSERARLWRLGGAKACAERTENMMSMMYVTLDVSKLSGWLNFDVSCRVERRACDAGRGVGREAGRRGSAAAHERHARREGPVVKAGGAIGHARSAP